MSDDDRIPPSPRPADRPGEPRPADSVDADAPDSDEDGLGEEDDDFEDEDEDEDEDDGFDEDFEQDEDEFDEDDSPEDEDEDEDDVSPESPVSPDAEDASDDVVSVSGSIPERRVGRTERLPVIAIVGRPNTGKSTLFNCLVRRRTALVHDRPGMTRDRRMERMEWGRRGFLLVDTGGFDVELDDPLLRNVVEQARIAIQEADAVIWLAAVNETAHPAELEMQRILRRAEKPVLLAVNKCDNHRLELEANEWFSLGFEEIFPVSAMHGRGITPLMERLVELLDERGIAGREVHDGGIRVAIVGRQNVGKSSLLNRIVGEERVIASDLPGTTRDAIDTTLRTPEGDVFTLIDTAGIRRRGKVERGVEKISVLSSMMAMRRADVAIVVVDGTQGLTAQDAHIAGYCEEEGLASILAVNKWDIVEKDHRTADEFAKTLRRETPFLAHTPIVYVSALSGQRVPRVLEIAKRVHENAGRRIPTPRLNELVKEWTARRSPPLARNVRPKIKYAAQTRVHPPTFVFFANVPESFHFSYRRYLANCIREAADFEGTPIRIRIKAKGKRRDEE